jgi:hypothetical protein
VSTVSAATSDRTPAARNGFTTYDATRPSAHASSSRCTTYRALGNSGSPPAVTAQPQWSECRCVSTTVSTSDSRIPAAAREAGNAPGTGAQPSAGAPAGPIPVSTTVTRGPETIANARKSSTHRPSAPNASGSRVRASAQSRGDADGKPISHVTYGPRASRSASTDSSPTLRVCTCRA